MTKSWKPKSEKEIGRINIDDTTDIVVREVVDDNDNTNIDMRIFTKGKKFSGFSNKGVYVPKGMVNELISLLERGKK